MVCHRHCIKSLDYTMKNIKQNRILFGLNVLLFDGDFRRILPVVPFSSRVHIVNTFVKSSFLYHNSQTILLIENMRLQSLLLNPVASEVSVQSPQFLFQVDERKVLSDAKNYIDVPQYIYNACNRKNLNDYSYEKI